MRAGSALDRAQWLQCSWARLRCWTLSTGNDGMLRAWKESIIEGSKFPCCLRIPAPMPRASDSARGDACNDDVMAPACWCESTTGITAWGLGFRLHILCRVICMSCGEITHRQKLQNQLLELNPGAAAAVQRTVRPPGHVTRVATCSLTAGLLIERSGCKDQICGTEWRWDAGIHCKPNPVSLPGYD